MLDQQTARMKVLLEKYIEVFFFWWIGLIKIEGFLIENKSIKRKRDTSYTQGFVVFKDNFGCEKNCNCYYKNSNAYEWVGYKDCGPMFYGFKEDNNWVELESKLIIAKETLPEVKKEFLKRNLMFLEILMDACEKEPEN